MWYSMVAFDIVMAFVALVSFIAGFCCSHKIYSQERSHKAPAFKLSRKKIKKDYVRIEDREAYEYEPKTEGMKNTGRKASKFDVLLNYFSGKSPKKEAWEPSAPSCFQKTPVFKTEEVPVPLYAKAEPVKRDIFPEIPSAPATQPVAPPVAPVQKNEEVRKKENSGDEWVPMGFFED